MEDAGCELCSAWANGALLLVPITDAEIAEAGIELAAQNIMMLAAEEQLGRRDKGPCMPPPPPKFGVPWPWRPPLKRRPRRSYSRCPPTKAHSLPLLASPQGAGPGDPLQNDGFRMGRNISISQDM